jgi:hypothetical protein
MNVMKMKQSIIIILMVILLTPACNNNQAQTPPKMIATDTIVFSTNTAQPHRPEAEIRATKTVKRERMVNTDTPVTATKVPTKTPLPNVELSSTPVPPLEAHEWVPEIVIASLDHEGGDGCHQFPSHPELVLYSDGQLFIKRYNGQYLQLLTKQLKRQDVCAFLNTVDQLGFFDYDANTYSIDRYGHPIQNFSVEGSNTQIISINAWRSKGVALYALGSYLSEPSSLEISEDSYFQAPTILPAVKNTYQFLNNYNPEGMEVYRPESIELWIGGTGYPDDEIKTWPMENELSLEDIIKKPETDDQYTSCISPFQSSRKIVLTGSTAEQVYDIFSQSIYRQVFTDGENTVELFMLPVLPYTNESTPTPFMMRCTPSDGKLTWKP